MMPIVRRWATILVLSGVAVLHVLLYSIFFANSYAIVGILTYSLAAIVALALATLRTKNSTGTDRRGWIVMAGALGATATLDALWSVVTRINGEVPGYVTWFDPLYLASYVAYIVAVGLLTSPLWKREDRRWLFDAGALIVVAAGILWHFVIPRTNDGDLMEKIVGATYLVLDLCILATVLTAAYTGRLTLRNALLMVAATVLAVGDILYYFDAGAFDLSWLAGLWMIAVAAVVRPEIAIRIPQVKFARAAAVPYVFVAICVAITLNEMRRGDADALLVAGILGLGLVVGRQVVSLRGALAVQRQETAFRETMLEAQSQLGLGMAILDGRRVVYANAACARITGLSSRDLETTPSFRGLDVSSERSVWETWAEDPAAVIDAVLTRRDGTAIDVEIAGRQMQGTGGEQTLLVIRDVTARKQSDQALARAQRFEGLGALAGGVAHDFNNLLSTVLGNVGLLEMGELDKEASESVASIKSAAVRGAELTRSLLDFARTPAEQFATEDLRQCLQETAALARPAIPVNVRFLVDLGAKPVIVELNRGQMVQAILNLILNARDAVGESGEIAITLKADGESAHLSVRDSGKGMDEATQRRIFEPFFTTKAVGAGTGLGLAITHRTIREHQGSLSVESSPGKGTTLTVRIPLAVSPA